MTKAVWLGLFICMVFLCTKSFADSNGKYWSDVENLCMKYSTATHPPCNRSNGAKMMIEHIEYMCKGDKSCMKDSVNLCIQYSPATHPPCNASNGLAMVLGEVERSAEFYPLKEAKAAAPKEKIPTQDELSQTYWHDIEALCMNYSGATHPPCNRTNGAKMILDDVASNCEGNKACLNKAVKLCIEYSPATHPPCDASNGLRMVLDEVERVSTFYKENGGSGKAKHGTQGTATAQ